MEVVSKKIRLSNHWPERREENPGESGMACAETQRRELASLKDSS